MSVLASIDFSLVERFVRREGDRALKDWRRFSIAEYKDGGRDLSTNFDQEIERRFYKLCTAHFPEFGFKGEEFPHLNNPGRGKYIWHIDPIDGTKSFATEVPLWSVTVSLVMAGKPVFGIIYNPTSKQLYSAREGAGAYLNGRRLRIEPIHKPRAQQLAIDFFMPQTDQTAKGVQGALLSELYDNFYRVRSIGSGSLSLAWLAQGHFSSYFSWGLTENKFTDIAAGLTIAKEAGAVVKMEKLRSGKAMIAVGCQKTVEYLIDLAARAELEGVSGSLSMRYDHKK